MNWLHSIWIPVKINAIDYARIEWRVSVSFLLVCSHGTSGNVANKQCIQFIDRLKCMADVERAQE